MAGMTNRFKFIAAGQLFRGSGQFSNYALALCTSGVVPTADTNTFTGLTQIGIGNGYTDGGITIPASAIGFTGHTEDDSLDFGYVVMQNVAWTGSSGPIPAAGSGISFAVLTSTGASAGGAGVGNRDVVCYWDLSGAFQVSDAQTFTVQNGRISFTE